MGILSFLSPSPSKNGKSKGVKKTENGKNGNVRHDTEEPTLDIRPPTPQPLVEDIDPINTAVVAPQSGPETIDTSASAASEPSTGALGGPADDAASRDPSSAVAVASKVPQEPSHTTQPVSEATERKDNIDASSVSEPVKATQVTNVAVASSSSASLAASPTKQDDHDHKSANVVKTPSKKDIVLPDPTVLYEEVANGHPSASFIPAARSITPNRSNKSTSAKAEATPPSPQKTSSAEGAAGSPSTPTSPKAKRFSLQSLTSIVRRPSQQSKATESKPVERHSVEVKTTATKVAESVPAVKKRSATHDSAHGHLSRESTGLPAKRVSAAAALARRITQRNVSTSDKRAMQEALVVRRLIVGPAAVTLVGKPRAPAAVVTSAEMQSVKGALLEPRKANALIGKLRVLPGQPDVAPDGTDAATTAHGPIRAVCLPFTEEQAHQEAFHKLATKHHQRPPSPAVAALEHALAVSPPSPSHPVARTSSRSSSSSHSSILEALPSVLSASASALADTFDGLSLVNLVTAPGFGIGQPGDGKGLLSGAVPTAETVINGITQITPQLMNLGYATGREILPDHTGVYPPTDRLSVLTYWWGLEVVLPPPTLVFLSHAPSVAHAVINFLTAMSVANNGVAEILPFIRYISQYIDFEWNTIKQVDEGKGVVCAATWIMPAAMVPRAWDFADPPVLTTPVQPPAPSPASPTEGDVVHPPLAIPAALAVEAKSDAVAPESHPTES